MNNQEIDERLTLLSQVIPQLASKLIRENGGERSVQIEMELLNSSLMAVWTMLGEIAKRLPEPHTGEGFDSPGFNDYEAACGWAVKYGLDQSKYSCGYSGMDKKWRWSRK